MATATRVPLVSTTSSRLRHCHQSNWVESSFPLRRQPGSYRLFNKSLCYSSSSSSSSFLATTNRRGFRRLGVVVSAAMADLPTVLVTGAGGRTGTPVQIFSFQACMLKNIMVFDVAMGISTLYVGWVGGLGNCLGESVGIWACDV